MDLTRRTGSRTSMLFVSSLMIVMAACVVLYAASHLDRGLFVDAKAFYCAGRAVDAGRDPYRNDSLLACESGLRTLPSMNDGRGSQVTVPAPLPPIDLLPFALLALLPFGGAVAVWTGLNVLCAALAADRLRRALPTLPPMLIGALVVVSVLPAGIRLGQPTGLEFLAVVAAGLALRDGSRAGLIGWSALAALQPHVAVPLYAALLCASQRRARSAVAVVSAGLLALSALAFGSLSFEYVTRVLPAHASANLSDAMQLALPSGLAAAGVSPRAALAAGDAFFLLAIAAGVLLAYRVARGAHRAEALPWLATMIGTMAAPHLHLQQLSCALPGAFLLVAIGPARALGRVALYGLAVPWAALLLPWGPVFPVVAAAAAWRKPSPLRLLGIAALAGSLFALLTAVALAFHALAHEPPPHYAVTGVPAGALAERTWAVAVAVDSAAYQLASLPARGVTWAAELVLIALLCVAAKARYPVAEWASQRPRPVKIALGLLGR